MLRDLLEEAWRNLRAHWLRTILTASGVVWGLAMFVALSAAGEAMSVHYAVKMEAVGRRIVYVFPGVVAHHGEGARSARGVKFDFKDPPRLTGSPTIEHSAPEEWSGPRVMKGGGHTKVVWTYGVTPSTQEIRNFNLARGRFINLDDMQAHARVLVIGAKVEQRLFGSRSALGEEIHLEGWRFRVVGVSQPKGEQMVNMGPRDDEQVLMPITTAKSLFTHTDRIGYLIYEPLTREQATDSLLRTRTLLGLHHSFIPGDEEAVAFFNIADIMKLLGAIGTGVNFFLGACGILTLTVGAIGVMNIMLVAVTERTREIGLRKALGATDRDLFVQLLFETVFITVAAGLVGMCGGATLIYVMEVMRDQSERSRFLMPQVSFSPRVALLSFTVLVVAGVLAGILPAIRAARLDPASALREE